MGAQDEADSTQRVRWMISGRVQGVGFRWFVQRAAERHGVTGYVRNLSDGRVEVCAHGAARSLDRMLQELQIGPRGSRVERIDRQELAAGNAFDGFEIRH